MLTMSKRRLLIPSSVSHPWRLTQLIDDFPHTKHSNISVQLPNGSSLTKLCTRKTLPQFFSPSSNAIHFTLLITLILIKYHTNLVPHCFTPLENNYQVLQIISLTLDKHQQIHTCLSSQISVFL